MKCSKPSLYCLGQAMTLGMVRKRQTCLGLNNYFKKHWTILYHPKQYHTTPKHSSTTPNNLVLPQTILYHPKQSRITLNNPELPKTNTPEHVWDCSGFLLKINYEITQTLFGLVQAMLRVVGPTDHLTSSFLLSLSQYFKIEIFAQKRFF